MGGIIIIIGMISSTLLWADLSNVFIWTLIFVSLSLGVLGFIAQIVFASFFPQDYYYGAASCYGVEYQHEA